jgi:hypothetical protein
MQIFSLIKIIAQILNLLSALPLMNLLFWGVGDKEKRTEEKLFINLINQSLIIN